MKLYHEYDKIEVGIDEVGRGCLLGRVYSAAVILPKEIDPDDEFHLEIKDSKKHSAKNRELLDEYIKHIALDWQVSYQEVETIDSRQPGTAAPPQPPGPGLRPGPLHLLHLLR